MSARSRLTARPSTKGFTMLELIVVIVILGILAAIAIPTFQAVIGKSKDAATKESVTSITHDAAALMAFQDGTTWPTALQTAATETSYAAAPGALAAGSWSALLDTGQTTLSEHTVYYTVAADGTSASVRAVSSGTSHLCTATASFSGGSPTTCGSTSTPVASPSPSDSSTPAPTDSATPTPTPTPTPTATSPATVVVDHAADATTLSSTSGTLHWDNTGFDSSADVYGLDSYGGWVKLTPTHDSAITVDTSGSLQADGVSGEDTLVDVYEAPGGTSSNLAHLYSDDSSGGNGAGRITFDAFAGVTYYVEASVYVYRAPTATMVLNWSGLDLSTPGPQHVNNDAFSAAQVISGTGQDLPFNNYDYTMQSGEPTPSGVPSSRSAWYTFTPTASGTATVDSSSTQVDPRSGASTDTYLVLYYGAANAPVTGLTQLAGDDSSGGNGGGRISYSVVAGQTYYVQLLMYQQNAFAERVALKWNIS